RGTGCGGGGGGGGGRIIIGGGRKPPKNPKRLGSIASSSARTRLLVLTWRMTIQKKSKKVDILIVTVY
ncbi:unnamed protein product, partial [Rotaria sp. Silwood1]